MAAPTPPFPPSPRDPAVLAHFASRTSLIASEKSQHSSFQFRQNLSPTAKKACDIVSRIRTHEHATIWTTTNSEKESENLFPGMIFNSAKMHMKKTILWRIVEKMPKGSLLHCHLGAMVDLKWVLETALGVEGMVISLDRVVYGKNDLKIVRAVIEYSSSPGHDKGSVWSPDYIPGTKFDLVGAAHTFAQMDFEPGPSGFIAWLVSKYTVSQLDSLEHHLGVDAIWRKFHHSFVFATPIVFYEPITRLFLRKIFSDLVRDNVLWVEIRSIARGFRLEGEDGRVEGKEGQLELIRVIDEEVVKFMAGEGRGKGFWGVRLIWNALRSFSDEDILADMHHCLEAKPIYPHLISGYDLVGPEDNGRTLASQMPSLLYFRSLCQQKNLTIPFFLHAGETLQTGGPTDHNLYDALLLKTRRLGHALSLYKHPVLIDAVKKRNVLVECCPISNELLRYTSSVLSHPLPSLLAKGVHASISNDDPGLMGHGGSGLTPDFWQCLQGWEDCGLAGLGSLAEDSVRWSNFEDQSDEVWDADVALGAESKGIRGQRIKEWGNKWEAFCEWIVDEYGETWGDDAEVPSGDVVSMRGT